MGPQYNVVFAEFCCRLAEGRFGFLGLTLCRVVLPAGRGRFKKLIDGCDVCGENESGGITKCEKCSDGLVLKDNEILHLQELLRICPVTRAIFNTNDGRWVLLS